MIRSYFFLCLAAAATLAAKEPGFEQTVQPFLAKNCLLCHSAKLHTSDLNLEQFRTANDILSHRDIWERIQQKIESGEMPPKGMPRPNPDQRKIITRWISTEFDQADKRMKPDPGRVTARRLNRYEYNNTIRDLLAVNFHPADDFPADDSGYGFDNIGDVLSLSPVLMEKYLTAAEKIAKVAIAIDPLPKPTITRHKRTETLTPGKDPNLSASHTVAIEGDYEISLGVNGRRDPLSLAFALDREPVDTVELTNDKDKPRIVEFKFHLTRGEHLLSTELIQDGPPIVEPKFDKRGKPVKPAPNPDVGYIELRGPFNPVPPPPPESHKKIFICGHPVGSHTAECARIDVADLARRAYRRPVTDEEVNQLVRFVKMAQDQGDSFEQGMRIAIEAMLVSPHFLFRIEHDADPTNPVLAHKLDEFELATRLSYFLWSSTPDDELYQLAAQQGLRKPGVLEAQVRRMLADPKSKALVENFGGQWLQLRNLDVVKPDPDKFPAFDAELRSSMKRETQMFFESIIKDDRGILDFIDAKYTFLNQRLAKFYGVPGVEGNDFRRVDLSNRPERGGVLTQAAILTVSSYPTRTSPVIRGKWVLENLLNAPPPPPPPNVPNLEESAIGTTMSLRQQLEKHRANPVCASCHAKMDPLGFGLENFDAIGRWRTHDGNFVIDASGTLPNGKSFKGPAELKQILLAGKDAFVQCLTEKLMIYALGRGLERYDKPAVQSIMRGTAAENYRFSGLVREIVNSMPFQMRRGDGGQKSE